MAFNIVDLVKDQISDQLLGQLGGAAGIDATQASSALSGAIPGLLSGLTGVANKPGGAGALLDAVNKQDDGLIGNLSSMLDQGQGNQLASSGGDLLTSLLGGGALGSLAKVIGGFAGIGQSNSSSLLGMLAPIVIGVIKKQVLGSSLDANGLSSMLSSQQSNVNAAMPQGLSDQLSSQGFFDSISGAAPDVSAPNVSAPNVSMPNVNTPDMPKSGGLPKWLIPLVAIGALAFFGFKFLTGQDAPDVGAVGDAASNAASSAADSAGAAFGSVTDGISTEAMDAAKAALPDGVDMDGLTSQLDGVFESTTSALGGITDADSATAALPQLTEASEGVSQFGEVFKRLPDAAKGPLASMLETGVGAVGPLLEKAKAIPGVGDIIEPIVGPMLATIEGLAG
jgi:hypothetical protein